MTQLFPNRWLGPCLLLLLAAMATSVAADEGELRDRYEKHEYRIPMRDGAHLFTAVYTPRDASPDRRYPILMRRTPYSVSPYGEDAYRSQLGPSTLLEQDGYIFVYQDVRGCYLSEGTFINMTPHLAEKSSDADVDESTDTYDTVEWLIQNIDHHNGRVGQWGISYPGFYAAAGMIDAHPALIAVSPQAPIADWWYDDFHHHGAFFLPHAFRFLASFGQPRPEPTTHRATRFDFPTPDGYEFFLDLGSLSNVNPRYYRDRIPFWNHIVEHPNYDEFWQSRNLIPHLNNVAPAVLIVGGWFDAEDLYGPLQIYRSIEDRNPEVDNRLVMGPWSHGGWARAPGDHLGNVHFGSATSEHYQRYIERPFFDAYLKQGAPAALPEAMVFETGANEWRAFDAWPPNDGQTNRYYLAGNGQLAVDAPSGESEPDTFVSDPARPVPFTEAIATGMTREYMTDDQRFASRRPDVLVYQTDVLQAPVTWAGPVTASLWVSTTGTDADWIVKVIDVFPPDAPDHEYVADGRHMGGYQMMVRSEVIRGRFREDPSAPKPFQPNEPTLVELPLQDLLHTFQAGHRIMVHVQSTWFPLVDRNPQNYVDNIFLAPESAFEAQTHRVYHSADYPSNLEVLIVD